MDSRIHRLMASLSRRTVEYLADEADLVADKVEFHLKSVGQVTLQPVTTLVSLSGGMEIYLAFSFNRLILEKFHAAYTKDIVIENDQIELFMEVSAGDLINLVTGNSLADVAEEGAPIIMAPPLHISGGKQIGRADDANIYMSVITFPEGEIDIICIGPAHLFTEELEYKEQ